MSRRELTSSSLFAKRVSLRGFGHEVPRALLIAPPIVSGATPTLEARGGRRSDTSPNQISRFRHAESKIATAAAAISPVPKIKSPS